MRLHRAMAVTALILGGGAAVSERTTSAETRRAAADVAAGRDRTSAVALAERIKSGNPPRVLDLRSQAEYDRFHIPSATRATIEDLRAMTLPSAAPIVLYGDDAAQSAHAWTLLRERGYRHVSYLRDGLYEWIVRVHEPALAMDATPAERLEFERLAVLSRYFGGQPRVDVPRAELPAGVATSLLVAAIRRRGC